MPARELKKFVLPQWIEARKRAEGDMESPSPTSYPHHLSQSSTLSGSTSPTTPSSTRGHSRLPSSTSSLASSPAMNDSIDGFGSAKRPLTDVREEPQDRDEDYEMVDATVERPSYEGKQKLHWAKRILYTDRSPEEVPSTASDADWSLYQPTALDCSAAYDFADDPVTSDFAPNPSAKRRCAEDVPLSPMDGLSSRLGSRMPSFSRSVSRKFKSRKASPVIAMPDRTQETGRSRANSNAPSLAGSTVEFGELKGPQLPPTPRRSVADDRFEDAYLALTNNEKTHAEQIEEMDEAVDHQVKPTTPLLPPIMTHLPSDIQEVPYQSPLQSPTVVDPEASSVLNSPLPTPRIAGLPSPPLSSRPSVASFHRQRGLGPVSPSAEIPSMTISDSDDKWAEPLGHANFNIYPEPYVAEDTTLMACKQLRADWEVARSKYLKHLVRTGENYGITSKVYRLTEEKWSEVDTTWKHNVELSFSRIPELTSPTESAATPRRTSRRQSDATPNKANPLTSVSSTDTPKVNAKVDCKFPALGEGKFPAIGDEGIVGPMEVVAPQEPQRKKRKMGFFRWMQGVWPAGTYALGRRHSSGN